MSESPDKLRPLIVQFCRAWTESFANVLGQLGVVSPKVTASEPAPANALSSEELAVTISFFFKGGGTLKGEQVWVAEKPAALQIAQLLLSEPLDPAAEFSDTHKDAFAEFLRQVSGQTATTWKQIAGGETEIAFQAPTDAVFVPAQSTTVQAEGEGFPQLPLRLLVNSILYDALSVAAPQPQLRPRFRHQRQSPPQFSILPAPAPRLRSAQSGTPARRRVASHNSLR
jgi:CheY-specific phosphatase CheX